MGVARGGAGLGPGSERGGVSLHFKGQWLAELHLKRKGGVGWRPAVDLIPHSLDLGVEGASRGRGWRCCEAGGGGGAVG